MIKLGILGATRGVAIAEAAGLFHRDDARITAVCDFYPAALDLFREKAQDAGIVYDTDAERFLDEDFDALILCNYANEHAPYAIRAALDGRHVLSELLPMQTMEEAVKLVEAVEKKGIVYNYAENYCFYEPLLEMRRRFDEGQIGKTMAAEAVFINDLSRNWPRLTHGDAMSWRNYVPSTFYCTHSIGPMLYVTGERAVRVCGMETFRHEKLAALGARAGSAATELMQLSGGGFAKSMHGNLKRNYTMHYSIFGTKGTMETDKYDNGKLYVSIEKPYEAENRNGRYEVSAYHPEPLVQREDLVESLGYSNYYVMECFLGSIRGEEKAKRYAIDVYRAMDMALPGFMAYRSILKGGMPVTVPDFRDKAQRDLYRNDRLSTDVRISGKDTMPTRFGETDLPPDSAYEYCRSLFEKGECDFW